ncbi:Hypothetical_protein [Hexamita inflata]|uniref:Hypothetical_protein n=1 Tax=Hexamita inflata TaxID=28002 RepID=A0AA86Q9T4_9EUKA|nr:Hypothetical protein HINF_LOCUS42666 [Hexamita inflata]
MQLHLIIYIKERYKKIQSLKEKIAKLQRELQSQFDTAAAVMRKFKETKKKHDDKKITQKTSNAEAQPENEKKKTKVSQKAEPTKNIEEKAPDKTKPKDAQKQKEKKPPVQKSQDQKTNQKPQSNTKFQVSSKGIYIYIHFTSSRRHKQTSLRLSKAKHWLSHASVSTFKHIY